MQHQDHPGRCDIASPQHQGPFQAGLAYRIEIKPELGNASGESK
jgi:hypothetical protein